MSIADQPTLVPVATPSDVATFTDRRADAERSLARGSVLSRYVVLEELGAGAMGRVYAAYDPRLDRKVALKLIRDHPAFSPAPDRAQRQLLREAQSLARLAHPNVVTVHDVEIVDDDVVLAMEFVTGQTLRAWMAGEHDWRAKVGVFRDAAWGLAAAHRAGVIHRDFKPDNVMVGDDGRARVVDFGLARSDVPTSDEPSTAEEHVESMEASRTAGVAGTPAYMAPELFSGGAADARSDQFSFCVALFEGLYGRRPFTGTSLASMAANVMAGRVLAPERGEATPRWLYRVVVRGLAPDPVNRWPDMEALAEQLARDPAIARRRWFVAGGVGVMTLAGAGLIVATRSSPCAADPRLEELWNDDARAEMRASIVATGAAWAERAAAHAESAIDRQLADLVQMTRDNCEATRVRGEQSEAVLDLRGACLAANRRELAAVVKRLRVADADVVRESVRILEGLSSLDVCADVESLRQLTPLPSDPDTRSQIDDIRTRLAEIDVTSRAAKYEDAIADAREVLESALAVDFPPLQAEARYAVGYLQDKLGQYAEAEATLVEAALQAARHRDDRLAVRAMSDVVFVMGSQLGRVEEAMVWARHAEVASDRADDPVLRAKFLNSRALLYSTAGRFADAERDLREAVALRERELGPNSYEVVASLGNLAVAIEHQGRGPESIVVHRDAVHRAEALHGPEHPRSASLLVNLADALNDVGEYTEALALARRAEAIFRATMPADHPHLGIAIGIVGAAQWGLGDLDGALVASVEALRIQGSRLGPNHHDVAIAEHNIGAIAYERGDLAQARKHFAHAVEIFDRALGAGHPESAASLNSVGVIDLLTGHPEAALSNFSRARSLLDKAGLLAREEGAQALRGLGKAKMALGRPGDAIKDLEQAIVLFQAGPQWHDHVAVTRVLLARTLWLAGEQRRAAEVLAQARREYHGDAKHTLERIGALEQGFADGKLPQPNWD